MVQLMPLPLYHILLHKNPEWFTFLVLAYRGCPGKRPLNEYCYYLLSLIAVWLTMCILNISLSSVFCCRAGSGYPNGYPVLGNSRGAFPLPSSRFAITYCDQSFPFPWHCLSAAPSLSGATLLSTQEGVPLSTTWGRGCSPVGPQPSANLSHQQTPPVL